MQFDRITVNLTQTGGASCIRGPRVPVATIVGPIAQGMAERQILAEYPVLSTEDIRTGAEVCGCRSR